MSRITESSSFNPAIKPLRIPAPNPECALPQFFGLTGDLSSLFREGKEVART